MSACLERLGEILGGVRSADIRRGSEAAAHAAIPAPPQVDLANVPLPATVAGDPASPSDPTSARPLR